MHKEGGIRLVGEGFVHHTLVGAHLIDQNGKTRSGRGGWCLLTVHDTSACL